MNHGLCSFFMGERLFGLDVDLVSEIVNVGARLSVPSSPSFVLGLFVLRGAPIALLDLGEVLGFAEADVCRNKTTALILKREETCVAFAIDRMDAVLNPDRGNASTPDASDHPAVSHFLTLDDEPAKRVVTVLDPAFLLERLEAVRMRKEPIAE